MCNCEPCKGRDGSDDECICVCHGLSDRALAVLSRASRMPGAPHDTVRLVADEKARRVAAALTKEAEKAERSVKGKP